MAEIPYPRHWPGWPWWSAAGLLLACAVAVAVATLRTTPWRPGVLSTPVPTFRADGVAVTWRMADATVILRADSVRPGQRKIGDFGVRLSMDNRLELRQVRIEVIRNGTTDVVTGSTGWMDDTAIGVETEHGPRRVDLKTGSVLLR